MIPGDHRQLSILWRAYLLGFVVTFPVDTDRTDEGPTMTDVTPQEYPPGLYVDYEDDCYLVTDDGSTRLLVSEEERFDRPPSKYQPMRRLVPLPDREALATAIESSRFQELQPQDRTFAIVGHVLDLLLFLSGGTR